jgi:hypothetical protein
VTLFFDNLELYDTTAGPAPAPGTPAPPAPTPAPAPAPAPAPVPAPPLLAGTVLAATSESFGGPVPPVFTLATFGGGAATISSASGAARVAVTQPGAQRFDLQLRGPSLTISAAKSYTIAATVAASAPTSLEVLWLQEAPIAPIGPKSFAIGPTATQVAPAGVKPAISGPHHVQVPRGGRVGCRPQGNPASGAFCCMQARALSVHHTRRGRLREVSMRGGQPL